MKVLRQVIMGEERKGKDDSNTNKSIKRDMKSCRDTKCSPNKNDIQRI